MNGDSRLQSLTELVERFLPLQEWGFKQNVQFFGKSKPLLYVRPEKWGLRLTSDLMPKANRAILAYVQTFERIFAHLFYKF